MALNHNILLEVGTNEFEIVEFIIKSEAKNYYFCINVAKVREVVMMPEETIQVPDAHRAIIGTANLRSNLIPIINLGQWLGIKNAPPHKDSKVIVTYFNGSYNGFLVDEVVRIHRVTWNDVKEYTSMTDIQIEDSVLGVVTIDGKLIQLLDFERIVSEINPSTMIRGVNESKVDMSKKSERSQKKIFLADDSAPVRKLLTSNLNKVGYNVSAFENGTHLLQYLKNNMPDLIITDLEMPGGSGDYVVLKVREKEIFNRVPIIVFSSMISSENERKLLSIGATMFIGKPSMDDLVASIDAFMLDGKEFKYVKEKK